MKVKRSKKDFWMPAAPLRVDGADPKARLAHVNLLWSTTAWSTAVMEHPSHGAPHPWSTPPRSTAAWSITTVNTAAVEYCRLEHPIEEHHCLEPWSTGAGDMAVSSRGFCKSAVQQKHDVKMHI